MLHLIDSTHHNLSYTSFGTLVGTRNHTMGPPDGINPMTYHTMSGHSTTELCSVPLKLKLV